MNTMLTDSSLADEHVIVSECATKVYSKHVSELYILLISFGTIVFYALRIV